MLKSALIILLFFISFSTQACQIIPSNVKDEYYIGENCALFPLGADNANINSSTAYFVQYLYANSFRLYVDLKGDMQNKITFPVANQPYNHGYRMMVGPLTLDDAKYVLTLVKKMNYSDALIKSYTPEKEPTSIALPAEEEQQTQEESELIYPTMTPVYSLGAYTALLPTYDDQYQGKITRYNDRNLGSFTYRQAKAVCQAAKSRIANEQEYNIILSNMNFMMKYAVKSQFWLNRSETVTRIQNHIAARKQSPNAYFNVICITK
ncbi:hypothetical protein [Vibrio gangliei]|uniref:hypothetical protein n=1 Tax=Vibrio gangliei TaxID=2077090 RepID=UPI000D018940|nr:hypothetical protein [Vibrio gangliei]